MSGNGAFVAGDDVWGWCATCERWFYVESGRQRGDRCPVCGSDAAARQSREPQGY